MDRAQVYLVTGGCGFIGKKSVELLSQQDYIKEVRVFDSGAREEKIIPGKTRASSCIIGHNPPSFKTAGNILGKEPGLNRLHGA